MPIIDSHIHLFDPNRPQGVPWPSPDDRVLYHAALPERYRRVTSGLPIAGAIVVECSPWLDDNQWVLDIAAIDPIVVGVVGQLDPGQAGFGHTLEKLHRNPLYRGIRYGNLWGLDLGQELARPEFVAGLRLLASAGLVLDTANPTQTLFSAVLRATDIVPDLQVVIDHLPQIDTPRTLLTELASRPQVVVKVSEVLRREQGRVPLDLAFYRDRLDAIFEAFGEDRVLYGSDWPNSDQWGSYHQVFGIVREYFAEQSQASGKYFCANACRVYGVRERSS